MKYLKPKQKDNCIFTDAELLRVKLLNQQLAKLKGNKAILATLAEADRHLMVRWYCSHMA